MSAEARQGLPEGIQQHLLLALSRQLGEAGQQVGHIGAAPRRLDVCAQRRELSQGKRQGPSGTAGTGRASMLQLFVELKQQVVHVGGGEGLQKRNKSKKKRIRRKDNKNHKEVELNLQ